MQKNLSFDLRLSSSALSGRSGRHSGKLSAVFIGILTLFCLFGVSETLRGTSQETVTALSDSRQSMYKQLDGIESTTVKDGESSQRMNNLNYNNANISIQPTVFSSDIPNLSITDLQVLDAASGAVQEMNLEDYVLCALIAEMPQSFEKQALMAQAVACRTFAVRAALKGDKHQNADVCTDFRCCQSFRNAQNAGFDVSAASEAVRATRGIVMLYGGEPILAAYHASSVGRTRSSAEVWGGTLDYLVPVAAVESKESAAETKRISASKLRTALKKQNAAFDGKTLVFSYDEDGICTGVSDGVQTLTPRKIQNAAGLRSDTFSVTENGQDYIFTCYGYGHGVGMSQYGANALAKAGYDFYEILKYYYTGISFGFCL